MIVNIWNSYIWKADYQEMNMGGIFAVMKHCLRPEKNSGLYGIWTYDLCDAGAVLYQLC